MAILTLEELKRKHPQARAKKIFSLEEIERESEVRAQTEGNQFNGSTEGFFSKARNVATNIFGGRELAEGLGKAVAAPSVQKGLSEAEQMASDTALLLVKQINKAKSEGKDTSRLERALADLQGTQRITRDAQEDFTSSLPSNRQVVGSALRLGATAALPGVAGALSKRLALGKASSLASGAVKGAGVGFATGALEGGVQGFGAGLEQDQNVSEAVKTGALGAGLGAVTSGILGGAVGGATGAIRRAKDPNKVLEYITPQANELTPTQYKRLVAQGRIEPKTATQPAQYILNEAERNTALKYSSLLDKDPVKSAINISDQIGDLDEEVGRFLKQNNGIFNKGELRNYLGGTLDDITDITIDEQRLSKAKEQLIDNFVKNLKTNDMESLWMARKNFDRTIENAFKGSPTIQKEMKIAFRNAVQDFIADRTPNATYKEYMSEMSNLFRLQDNVLLKASKERSKSGIGKWIVDNPKKAKALGWGGGLIIAGSFFNPFRGGDSND